MHFRHNREESPHHARVVKSASADAVSDQTPIHDFFGLSYASYLVLPRSILQSCTVKTQQALCDALAMVRLEEGRGLPQPWPGELHIRVQLQDPENGRFLKDDLADYQRGRRRLWEQQP